MQKREFILKADEGVAYRKTKDSGKGEEAGVDVFMDAFPAPPELLKYIPFCNDIILMNIEKK